MVWLDSWALMALLFGDRKKSNPSFPPWFILPPLPPARLVGGGATDLMIPGTVVPFTSTGGRYVTHLSVTLRQRLKFIFRACSKQVTHLLHLLSRDQHRTFLMLMSGIIGSPSVCLCVRLCVCFACNSGKKMERDSLASCYDVTFSAEQFFTSDWPVGSRCTWLVFHSEHKRTQHHCLCTGTITHYTSSTYCSDWKTLSMLSSQCYCSLCLTIKRKITVSCHLEIYFFIYFMLRPQCGAISDYSPTVLKLDAAVCVFLVWTRWNTVIVTTLN